MTKHQEWEKKKTFLTTPLISFVAFGKSKVSENISDTKAVEENKEGKKIKMNRETKIRKELKRKEQERN